MNSIPKEANFLAESGGSGSGYGGGWDSVQRFDHGSGRTWVLGATGSNSGSSGGEGPSPSLVLSVQEADLYWGKSGVGTSLFFPQSMQGPGVLQASLGHSSWASLQECSASLTSPPSLYLPLQGAKNLPGGGRNVCNEDAGGREYWYFIAAFLF